MNNKELKWIQYSKEAPPINTNVLVLVNGEIHEGYLDSVLLMGKDEPTIFETLYTNSNNHGCGSRQHTSWGSDPYWMYIPCEKPQQIKNIPNKWEVKSKESK